LAAQPFIASQGHLRWARVGGEGSEDGVTPEEVRMAYMLLQFEAEDYDQWKERFDSDPAGRKEIAKSYMIFRGVDDTEKVFVGVEFGSVEDARTFRERLLGSGALDSPDVTVAMPPTVVEVADRAEY
jgi:hypothetical protein